MWGGERTKVLHLREEWLSHKWTTNFFTEKKTMKLLVFIWFLETQRHLQVLLIRKKHKIKMKEKKKDVIRLEREAVIPILKHKLTTALSLHFGLLSFLPFHFFYIYLFLLFIKLYIFIIILQLKMVRERSSWDSAREWNAPLELGTTFTLKILWYKHITNPSHFLCLSLKNHV